jgi:hypothetical protein
MSMSVEIQIPREIPGQTPRKPSCRHELARVQLAAVEARQEIVDFATGVEDSTVLVQESDVSQLLPVTQKRTPRTVDVFRSVENHNLNNALRNPNSIRRVTESFVNFLVGNGEKVMKFARTLLHKGKLHPAVARELGMETRKGAKTSILERAS